jgi:peptidoglycan/LPS O-acetylase OafA/YrhL
MLSRRAVLPATTPSWQPSGSLGASASGVGAAAAAVPSTWIDLAKALASQLIVWHHLALYGPMCDVARSLAPVALDMLTEYARLVVQVFLVVGGFLAASSLWPTPGARPRVGWCEVPGQLWRRYQRLAKPYLLAVLAVIVAAWIARALVDHPTVPAAPEADQLAAHIALMQDVLGFPSLSAGFWYVAIDFQLYAALVVLAALLSGLPVNAARRAVTAMAAVLALVLMSLLWWNLDASLDAYAPYFAGAYGLGVLARWSRGLRGRRHGAALGLALLVGLALVVEWRSRIALAGATALLLCLAPEPAALRRAPARMGRAVLGALSRVSYPVFLLHYPVILVTGAVVNNQWPDSPAMNGLGMVLAWLLSLAAGAATHRAFEGRRPA